MTGEKRAWLQNSLPCHRDRSRRLPERNLKENFIGIPRLALGMTARENFFVTIHFSCQSFISKGAITRRKLQVMKQSLMLIAALTFAGFSFAQPPPGGPHHGEGFAHRNPLEGISESLNLTAEQKAKVQPIIDQAKPQLKAIHEEAMTKAKSVMDASIEQIRPLLTAEQQTKLDAQIKAHEDMMNAMKEMHDAKSK
jgi:Spy/CpxP family protein refolding chaperone